MSILVAGAVALGVVAIFCWFSIAQVDQNQYGLVVNWVTKGIDNKVYHGGTHFIGFWNKVVLFPATVRTIEFSDRWGSNTAEALQTRTKEGLGLHLSISFQYRLIPEEIPTLYAITNSQYEALFTRIARDQFLEAASEYEGPQYWLQREAIGAHMQKLVDFQLSRAHSVLWGLQLLVIDLPDAYEKSITMTQVQQQLVKTKQNEQVAASIRADTEVLQAEYRRQITVTQASANANYTLTTMLAEAEAAKRKISAEAVVLDYVRDKLKLSTSGTVKYQQLSAYAVMENATFLANVLGATPVVNAAAVSLTQQQTRPQGFLQTGQKRAAATAVEGQAATQKVTYFLEEPTRKVARTGALAKLQGFFSPGSEFLGSN